MIVRSPVTDPLGLLNCLSCLREHPRALEEILEAAETFDINKIRSTSLLGEEERRICLTVAKDPLALRHIARLRIRQVSRQLLSIN